MTEEEELLQDVKSGLARYEDESEEMSEAELLTLAILLTNVYNNVLQLIEEKGKLQ